MPVSHVTYMLKLAKHTPLVSRYLSKGSLRLGVPVPRQTFPAAEDKRVQSFQQRVMSGSNRRGVLAAGISGTVKYVTEFYGPLEYHSVGQGCTDPRRQVSHATEYCMVPLMFLRPH